MAMSYASQIGSQLSIMSQHIPATTLRYCSDFTYDNSGYTSDYNTGETTRRQNEVFSFLHCQSTTHEKEQKSAEDVCSDHFGFCIVLAAFHCLSVSSSFCSEFNSTVQFKFYNIWSVCLSFFVVSLHSESMHLLHFYAPNSFWANI